MRSRRLLAVLIASAAFVILRSAPAAAQVLVLPERDLSFGLVTPGVATTVAPTDMARSGQIRVQGRGRYQMTFVLPTQLTRLGGGAMPLTWGAADGRLDIRNQVTTFDPRQALDFRINPAQQEAQINLGGTVTPAQGQLAGTYEATIVVYVVQTGN